MSWPVMPAKARADARANEVPEQTTLYRSLDKAVSTLRWMTVAMLLFLTLLQPRMGRIGLQNWD